MASFVFFSLYVLVTALSLPGAVIMTLAGGGLFGLAWGFVLISFASTIGATLAFGLEVSTKRNRTEPLWGQVNSNKQWC